MTRIEKLFDEAVAAAPPSRLDGDELYGAGRARQRRHKLASGAAALVSAGVAIVVGAVSLGGAGGPPAGAAPPGLIVWVGKGDADHLYVLADRCADDPSRSFDRYDASARASEPEDLPTAGDPSRSFDDASARASEPVDPPAASCGELYASSDAGETWQPRGIVGVPGLQNLEVVGPQTLVRRSISNVSAAPEVANSHELSVDGGRHWTPMVTDDRPIDAVPAGGSVLHSFGSSRVMVLDPADRHVRSLAHMPDLLSPDLQNVPSTAGLWVSGLDPVTHRPAVAVSHDAGRTWTTRVFSGVPAVAMFEGFAGGAFVPRVASRDGQTAYATFSTEENASSAGPSTSVTDSALPGISQGPGPALVFRTGDGGANWQAGPSGFPGIGAAWVTADGRHVVASYPEVRVGGAGQAYADTTLPGLPEQGWADGSVAHSRTEAYVSEDGWTWRQVWPR